MQIDNDAGNLTCVISSGCMMLFMPFVTFLMLYVPVFWFSAMKTVLLQSNYKHKK